jgi:hypothetical protein
MLPNAPMRAVMALVACAALSACSTSRSVPPQGGPSMVSSGAPKAIIAGLIDMQDIAWHNTDAGQPTFVIGNVENFPGLFGGIVINATWDSMQTTAGGAVNFSAIDAALASVRAYNSTYPQTPLGVKLRIYNGNSAPAWAKSLSGGPITIYRNPAGCNGLTDSCPLTIGAFWTTPYITAWRAFQALVAAKYDTEPLIRAVAITSCASQTDEPFVPTTGPISKMNLANAASPYSDTAEQACLSGAVADYSPWHLTPIDFTFNTYSKFTGGTLPAFTISVMTSCRSVLGARCVLDNHVLESPLYAPDAAIYTAIQTAGGPINFQTQGPSGIGCLWPDTIAQGVDLGAAGIEIWPNYGGFNTLTVPQVQALASEFANPPPISGAAPYAPPCTFS